MRVIALFSIVDNRLRKSVSGEPFPQEKLRNATAEIVHSREHPDCAGPVDVGAAADVLRMRTRVATPRVSTDQGQVHTSTFHSNYLGMYRITIRH